MLIAYLSSHRLVPGFPRSPTKGPERVKGLYAFRSVIDHGARITLGSDFPVEEMNPLAGFYAAITRVSPDGTSPHGPGGWCVVSPSCFRPLPLHLRLVSTCILLLYPPPLYYYGLSLRPWPTFGPLHLVA